jgi:cytochrome c oxidase cbb3-type subunit I/II
METFTYDDGIARKFLFASVVWGIVGMLVGVIAALQLAAPAFNFDLSFLTFGRLRPLHTNAVIFAFAGNGFFCAAYYSTQRLLKARMFSDALSAIHFWGWQAIIVAAAITLPLGFTQGKEYAELEWPIDLAVVLVWVAFAVNFFGTIAKRRERHLYVAIWFYIASIITVAILYIFNNLALPAGPMKSYSIYAGVQDALMQWWYGHNAVAFFLTTPFLGLMYYFLPKAANRPVFSYRLSILHFWSLVFIYIWAGPHHLHYTAIPEWASTLGMLFSVMLWMPSWGGMINGLMTLRGAWHKVAADPVLKFYVVGITFYGMSTFEGPLMSVKAVNALSHYTDWTIAHVHAGALGWVGFMTFGTVYWLLPRIYQTKEMFSKKLCEAHFWLGTVGILLYIIPIYAAGLTQGRMWRAFDNSGHLAYPNFVETVTILMPMYWARVLGGTLYLVGAVLCLINLLATWARRPATYEEPTYQAPALSPTYSAPADKALPLADSEGHFPEIFLKIEALAAAKWHRAWERLPVKFSVMVAVAVLTASLLELVPAFLLESNVPTISSVKPYTPLELAGRDIYVAEGCYNCHSQMVRPIHSETMRYPGGYSKAGEFIYDRPFQWGSRRIGPDLHRVGGKYSDLWHVQHMERPQFVTPNSIMPRYPWLLTDELDLDVVAGRVNAMSMLAVPYTEDELVNASKLALEQAKQINKNVLRDNGGPYTDEDGQPVTLVDAETGTVKSMVALVAYLQRLGKDIKDAPKETASAVGGDR